MMNATLAVDKAGRIVLPKPVRDKLQLQAGDSLELESSEGQIVLRPIRATAQMRLRDGIWVFRTGRPVSAASVNENIQQMRDERAETALRPQRDTHAQRGKSR
jgi:AbrB family looped-hinge helix DNA binding protein